MDFTNVTTPIMLFLTVLSVAMIAFALWYFEVMFAKHTNRIGGLGMPVIIGLFSTFSVLSSLPAMLEGASAGQFSFLSVLLMTVVFLILFNIPTFWVYFVYRRTRKKLGLPVWPFPKKTEQEDSDSET